MNQVTVTTTRATNVAFSHLLLVVAAFGLLWVAPISHVQADDQPQITKNLKFGDTDPEVEPLKEILANRGYLDTDMLDETDSAKLNRYSLSTKSGVRRFQTKYKLTKSGKVDEATRNKLNALGSTKSCGLTLTSPTPDSSVTFPLSVQVTVNNSQSACKWKILGGKAGTAQILNASGKSIGKADLTTTEDWKSLGDIHFTATINSISESVNGDITLKLWAPRQSGVSSRPELLVHLTK